MEKFQLGHRHDIRTPEGRRTHGWKHVCLVPEFPAQVRDAARFHWPFTEGSLRGSQNHNSTHLNPFYPFAPQITAAKCPKTEPLPPCAYSGCSGRRRTSSLPRLGSTLPRQSRLLSDVCGSRSSATSGKCVPASRRSEHHTSPATLGGFRSTDNLIAMLYFTAGKLQIPATHRKQRRTICFASGSLVLPWVDHLNACIGEIADVAGH